ncbi:MAG: hypothetical protein ACR2QG_08980, partial [Gammaproteobacteria bacterium]
LIHTNSNNSSIDLLDLADPENPERIRSISVPGEPTSVSVSPDGNWAMAVVYAGKSKTAKKPIDPRLPGLLTLIDMRNPAEAEIIKFIGIGHQPDSITIKESGSDLIAIIAIENEPFFVEEVAVNEDQPGQKIDISLPGSIEIISIDPFAPERYVSNIIKLDAETLNQAGMLFPDDPQPEFVAASPNSELVAVTLQENNGIILIDLSSKEIITAFSVGKTSEQLTDLKNDSEIKLEQNYPTDIADQPYAGVRFPDGLVFHPDGNYLITADEGEFNLSGGRGFSIWSLQGELVWDDAGEIEREAAALDLYPDDHSEIMGVEIDGITSARFGTTDYAFALSEPGSFVAIYDVSDPRAPVFLQIIPTAGGPESAVAIPARNLLVVAGEAGGTITLISTP